MSSKEIQKLEFISNILSEDDKKNLVLKEFVSIFFQHVSFGYLENLCEQTSQNILTDIAKKAFDILKKSSINFFGTSEYFRIKFSIL